MCTHMQVTCVTAFITFALTHDKAMMWHIEDTFLLSLFLDRRTVTLNALSDLHTGDNDLFAIALMSSTATTGSCIAMYPKTKA